MSEDKFSANSRYATTESASFTQVDGTQMSYLRRRFIPRDTGTVLAEHQVVEGDRPDTIAAKTLGDPEQFWRICDVNRALHPRELTDEIGRRLQISIVMGNDE
jgi:hypothetical protein